MSVWQNPNVKTWQKPEKKPAQSLGDLMKRYYVKEPAASLGQFGHKLLNIPSKAATFAGQPELGGSLAFRPGLDYREMLGLPQEQNALSMSIGMAPELLSAVALPAARLGKVGEAVGSIPKAGKYLEKILAEALPQMGLAAAMSEPEDVLENAGTAGAIQAPFSGLSQLAVSPKPGLQRLAAYGLGGLGGAATTYGLEQAGAPSYVSGTGGLIAALLGKKAAGTKAMMMDELASGKNQQLASDRMAAAERIGLDFLTPEEAFNSPFLARKQGRLGKTDEGSELLYDKFQKRVESEQAAINKVLKDIHDPETMGPKAAELYKEAYKSKLPNDAIADLAQNEIVKHAINEVFKRPAYKQKLKDVPTESFAFWDQVKRAMDDMIEEAPRSEAQIIRDTKKTLVNQMDELSPEYKQARALEERKFAREGLEKAFDKTNINSGHAFYKALNSKEDFADLMKHLRNVPEAQQTLKDMRELFKDFRKESTINKVRGLEQVGMKQDRNDLNALLTKIDSTFTKGKFDKEAIEFITSKDWQQQLEEINKISDKQKRIAKTIEVFGKMASQGSKPFLETENYEVY